MSADVGVYLDAGVLESFSRDSLAKAVYACDHGHVNVHKTHAGSGTSALSEDERLTGSDFVEGGGCLSYIIHGR